MCYFFFAFQWAGCRAAAAAPVRRPQRNACRLQPFLVMLSVLRSIGILAPASVHKDTPRAKNSRILSHQIRLHILEVFFFIEFWQSNKFCSRSMSSIKWQSSSSTGRVHIFWERNLGEYDYIMYNKHTRYVTLPSFLLLNLNLLQF